MCKNSLIAGWAIIEQSSPRPWDGFTKGRGRVTPGSPRIYLASDPRLPMHTHASTLGGGANPG